MCDLIPVLENLKPINVGSKYTNPKVYIGIDDDKKEIGDAEVDDQGKITKIKLNQPVIDSQDLTLRMILDLALR